MDSRKYEVIMSVILILAVYITTSAGLAGKKINADSLTSVILPAAEESVGHTVVLDAGHGGADGGKISVTGTLEKELNLSIVMELKEILENAGYRVILTRENDNGLYSESDRNKKAADMKKRCEIIDSSNADIVVSIHLNSFSDSKVCGAQVFYYKHSAEGKKLASNIQKSFKENLDETNNRMEKSNDTYYLLLHTKQPVVIAECGFLSNEQEAALIETQSYREAIAQAVFKGINEYFGK